MRPLLLASVLALAPPVDGAALAEYASSHFTFHYPPIDAASIAGTAEHIERKYARVVGALGVTDMPRVHVTFYTSHAALEAATRGVAGVVPSWTYGLASAKDQIHCMSPNDPSWGPYDRRMSDLVHEFVHAITLRQLVLRNGDTEGVLGVSLAEFESQWTTFVRSKARISMR